MLEIDQAEQGGSEMDRFIDIHMYITSALQKTNMKAVGLQLALDLIHKKVRKTGLSLQITPLFQWHYKTCLIIFSLSET